MRSKRSYSKFRFWFGPLAQWGEAESNVRWTFAVGRTPGQGAEEESEAPVALRFEAREDHGRASPVLPAKRDCGAPQVRAGAE